MSNDVLADWKKHKFIGVGPYLADGIERLVILTDIGFWAEHIDELNEWCDQYGATAAGMTVAFPDDQTMTAFYLRWS